MSNERLRTNAERRVADGALVGALGAVLLSSGCGVDEPKANGRIEFNDHCIVDASGQKQNPDCDSRIQVYRDISEPADPRKALPKSYSDGQIVPADCVATGRWVDTSIHPGEEPVKTNQWIRLTRVEQGAPQEWATAAYANVQGTLPTC